MKRAQMIYEKRHARRTLRDVAVRDDNEAQVVSKRGGESLCPSRELRYRSRLVTLPGMDDQHVLRSAENVEQAERKTEAMPLQSIDIRGAVVSLKPGDT